jgi:hypothetical protein
MAHDVFLSYSSKDKPTADAACALLEGAGIRCWIAPRDILPGRDWGESIIDAIAASRVMVLIFSDHANHSPQVRREVERAVNKGVVIVPFRIENVPVSKSLEYFISVPHWMDAYSGGPMEAHLARLCKTVKALIQSCEQNPTPNAPANAGRSEAVEELPNPGSPGRRGGTGRRVAVGVALAAAVAAGVGVMSGRLTWPLPGSAAAGPGGGGSAVAARTEGPGAAPVADAHRDPPASPAASPKPVTPDASTAVTRNTPPSATPAPQPATDSLQTEAMSLRLTSIALVGRARFCVIDGQSLREGESAGRFTVRQIVKDHVVVERNGRQFDLRPQPVARNPEPGGWGDRADDSDGPGPGGPGGSRFPGGPGRDGSRGVDPFDSGYGNDGPPLPPPSGGGGGPGTGGGGGGGPGGRSGPGGRR